MLPSNDALTKVVSRARKVNSDEPDSLQFIFRPEYEVLDSGERFLLADIVSDGRFLIFATRQGLQMLQRSAMWIMDGTFKTCPSIFSQIYTIHGVIKSEV